MWAIIVAHSILCARTQLDEGIHGVGQRKERDEREQNEQDTKTCSP